MVRGDAGASKTPSVDVTIIGAGPTGLCCALLARQLGLSVTILDKRGGPLEVGRADALNARTQQMLDNIGVLKELRPHGLLCNTSSVFRDGVFQSRNNRWWTAIEGSFHKEFLIIGQSEVEKAFVKNLDIDVRYDTEVISATKSSECVRLSTAEETITSKYLIAADGGKSTIRKQLGINFRGDAPNMRWVVLDTFIETDFPVCNEIITFEQSGQSRVSWIPRERGMARFYVLLEGDEVSQQLAEECIQQCLAPHVVKFVKTEWFSTYDVQERVAESFISPCGKILLAGDAGHIHAVNGGQGLNTGNADAFALIWRLHLAITSRSPGLARSLLDSYDIERRGTAEGVVNVAAKLVRSTLRTAQEYVSLIEKNAGNITGMGINYLPNALTVMKGEVGGFVAGTRFPDITFTQSTGPSIRLYEMAKYGTFIVFKGRLNRFEAPVWRKYRAEIWNVEENDDGCTITTPAGATLGTDMDFKDDSVVIMRPDFYVGYAGDDGQAYFARYSD